VCSSDLSPVIKLPPSKSLSLEVVLEELKASSKFRKEVVAFKTFYDGSFKEGVKNVRGMVFFAD
jgi:hypothetical protein